MTIDRDVPSQPPAADVLRVFLLPTGPEPGDYRCAVDPRGVASPRGRVRLEVWAARPDVDLVPLPGALRRALARPRGDDPEVDDLERRLPATQRQMAIFGVGFLACLAFLRVLPSPLLFVLLLLGAFVCLGLTTHRVLRWIELRARLAGGRHRSRRRHRSLLDRLEAPGEHPLADAEVRVHPTLEAVLGNMRELDGRPALASGEAASPEAAPALDEHLRDAAYRAHLPELYHPLLDAELGPRRSAEPSPALSARR